MSRVIKFRVWDSRFKKYVNPGDTRIKTNTGEVAGVRGGGPSVSHWHLEQYTGIDEKSSGECIYEGDLLAVPGDRFFGQVFFDDRLSCFSVKVFIASREGNKAKHTKNTNLSSFIAQRENAMKQGATVIIGNINENSNTLIIPQQ